MRACPVCEHVQEVGVACDVCGKELVAAVEAKVQVPLLADLEVDRWEEGFPEDPAQMTELELTSLPLAGLVASEIVSDLEATANAPVEEIAGAPLEEMDTGRSLDAEARTPARAPGPATCRYCQNVQTEGRFCDRCGMRLAGSTAPSIPRTAKSSDALVSCRRCSEKVRPGTRCQACGMTAPEVED